MTVGQLKKLLKLLPNSMSVAFVMGDNMYSLCKDSSGIEEIEDVNDGLKELIMLLYPCECEVINKDFIVDENDLNPN